MGKCGDCVFLEKDDDFPYCATLPLYTERSPEDETCKYFVDDRRRETNDERGQDPADVG